MAISGSSLADGQLPSSEAILFTATSITYEKILTLFNTSASTTETVKIYFMRLASAPTLRQIREIVLEPKRSYELDIPLPMVPGDEIHGVSTNATTVDYVLGGGVTS